MALSVLPSSACSDRAVSLLETVRRICDARAAQIAAAVRAAASSATAAHLGRAGLLSRCRTRRPSGAGAQPTRGLPPGARGDRRCLAVDGRLGVGALAGLLPPVAVYGTDEQRARWLPDMLGGEQLGAYACPQSGSDAGRRAVRGDVYVVTGTKAWIYGGVADYNLMVRVRRRRPRHLLPARRRRRPRARARRPGADGAGVPDGQVLLDGARLGGDRLDRCQGGAQIALAALDAGRLGIAACAVGLAHPLWTRRRRTKGAPPVRAAIGEFRGVVHARRHGDVGVGVAPWRNLEAARRKDRRLPFSVEAAKANCSRPTPRCA